MDFYDIHEQTAYAVKVSKPENMEDLSDLFITEEELTDIVGRNPFVGNHPVTITLKGVIEAEVKKLTDKLEASSKKTIPIDNEELLEVLKTGYLSDYTPGCDLYGRHGDRICYARRYKRKKHKATQGDVKQLWDTFQYAFKDKYGCYPSHIPRYDRHLPMFRAWQKIIGWRRVRTHIHNKDTLKFYRQIWDNPEEYIR